MRRLPLALTVGVVLAVPAWAGTAAPPAAPAAGPSAAPASLPTATRRVEHQRAEVKRLEQEVARQELGSHEASRRLQQQDREIAALRRKLRQSKGADAAVQP